MFAVTHCIAALSTSSANCFQVRVTRYNEFLEHNVDGTPSHLNSLAHIYHSTLANNETYTLKEMLQQPDKESFMEAMHEEVDSMFREGIWEIGPKSHMRAYYKEKREAGFDVKRHQIMMI